MSEVEERPRLVTGGYGRHRHHWVKNLKEIQNKFEAFYCKYFAIV